MEAGETLKFSHMNSHICHCMCMYIGYTWVLVGTHVVVSVSTLMGRSPDLQCPNYESVLGARYPYLVDLFFFSVFLN